MKIISWNVNGIRAVHRKELFTPFVDKYKPDVICIQETKAQKDQSPIDLKEYEEYWNSATRKGYSGTAIFSKVKPIEILVDLPSKIVKKYNISDDGYGNPNEEGRVIAAEFKDFFVVNVYTPNSKEDLSRVKLRQEQWDPAMLTYLKQLEKKKPVIFCGDLNVAHTPDDIARPKENEGNKGYTKEERSGMDEYVKNGFIDIFRHFTTGNGHYTWWSHWAKSRERNVGWRIDYFLVSKKLVPKIKKAVILPEVLGSDHCPISLEV